ncbi:unnamed protein product [Macrosiphum euphorbiae]|uniref:Uncharacterized protein n=1 Tax=Macrosiphum euphorbiae TaxID=13131 RepID=A0AAV0WZF7_9HEMI|nr:unnamed protein product [Macrosiphum euphorbiae]
MHSLLKRCPRIISAYFFGCKRWLVPRVHEADVTLNTAALLLREVTGRRGSAKTPGCVATTGRVGVVITDHGGVAAAGPS